MRALDAGVARSEDIWVEDPPVDSSAGRPLLADLMVDGEARPRSHRGRGRRGRARITPPRSRTSPEAFALSRGEPVLPTRYL
ncbi:MAG: hypothetical protein R2717_06580 [Schumannella sp.]